MPFQQKILKILFFNKNSVSFPCYLCIGFGKDHFTISAYQPIHVALIPGFVILGGIFHTENAHIMTRMGMTANSVSDQTSGV